jgi:RimJ/RimL family protein N-acetyltransferase
MGAVVVRDMTPGDAVLLGSQLLWDPSCAGWPGPDLSLDAWMLSASVDCAPVGFVVAELVDESVAALVVWVAPLRRRRGVGSELLSVTSARLAGEGVEQLEAVVDVGNEAMEALARRSGFVCVDGDGSQSWWRRRV